MDDAEQPTPEQGGHWLRETRRRRGFTTAAAFANALNVDSSRISNYERGKSTISDERADRIAEVLGLHIIEVRRHLGMWVPDSCVKCGEPTPASTTTEPASPAEAELAKLRTEVHEVHQEVRRLRVVMEHLAPDQPADAPDQAEHDH